MRDPYGVRARSIIERILKDQETFQGGAWDILSRLGREYLSKYWRGLSVAFGVSALSGAVQMGFPLTARFLVDRALSVGQDIAQEDFGLHARLVLAYFGMNMGLWTALVFSQWMRSRLVLTIGQQLVFLLRKHLNEKLQQLHIGFYERTPSGKIASRMLDDVEVVRQWTTRELVDLVAAVTKLLFGIALVFYLNWKLALLTLCVIPVYGWSFYVLRPLVRRTHMALRRLNASMYARATERIGGIAVVKAFGREKGELAGMAGMAHDYVRVGNRLVFYNQLLALIAGSVSAAATGLIVYTSALYVKSGVMTLGDLIAFAGALGSMLEPVRMLTNLMTQFQGVLVVLRRIFTLLDERVDVVPGHRKLETISGPICFDHVRFTYPNQKEPALKDVNFCVQPGEQVALMGPSGSGKSSIFQLLMRFYDPQEGQVRIGNENLVDVEPHSLRHHIGLAQQEPFIFSGTIAANIVYGRLDATPTQIMKASQRAELHEFIMTLPIKYETEVGERGIALSGGQKQRLALATALLTDPEILLLDDITSALDAQTELRIRSTIKNVLRSRTSLIITQRIAMARGCDQIIVFENGRISATGVHEELIERHGFYRTICAKQGWLLL